MPKKMKLPPLLFKHKNPPQEYQPSVSSPSRQPWMPCKEQPKTLSFRATLAADSNCTTEFISTLNTQDSGDEEEEELENVIREVRKSSARLFFSPEKTNSILKITSTDHKPISSTQVDNNNTPMTIAIESLDPYMDFKTSMEEMVEAYGLCEWDLLEELLGYYVMLNENRNHSYIIRAFVDLVLKSHFPHLTSNASDSCSTSLVSDSFSSPMHLSSSSTIGETSCSSSIAPPEAA